MGPTATAPASLGRPASPVHQWQEIVDFRKWCRLLPEQILNSAIVAAITALSMLSGAMEVSGKAVGIAFGLTFLVELRKNLNRRKDS